MQTELEFENSLIDHLTKIGGDKQWKYEPQIETNDQLWDNFKQILENHNQDKLEKPLSDTEFSQVKNKINSLETPYEAGRFLYGLNGYCQVDVDLDNGKHKVLTIFDQQQVGAGDTIYQVVNQIKRPAKLAGRKPRRFDVTLLINGLPIIQIEEKKQDHFALEALNQMEQYIDEDQYSDIFSTVQILVAMTPDDTYYMANTTKEDFNIDFAFRWQHEKTDTPVSDWKEFSNLFLSIPMAHKMATEYMILDGAPKHKSIKVMRSYQVYATKNVLNKVRQSHFDKDDEKLGYIWHTTGSGKTISSFKTAWLASRLPNVDKVVFVVDRLALTNQTADAYSAYDPNTDENNKNGNVFDTKNTRALKKQIESNGNGIIVTSIQKLDRLVQSQEKMTDKNILFIVDECHRSTAGDMMKRAQDNFKHSSWVGYTGTPRFAGQTGDGPTTEEIFGEPLAIYTIKQAVADNNVLGFKVDYNTTIPEGDLKDEYLPNLYQKDHPEWDKDKIQRKIDGMTFEDMDDEVNSSVYDFNQKHIEKVVDDLINNWKSRSGNYQYKGMITTHVGKGSSSQMAMRYYDEIQKRNKNLERPIKVGVTFSQATDNGSNQLQTNEDLRRAMQHYNKEFNTNFDDDSVKEYFDDVVSRLNGTIYDGNELDLVIVVDQLLTGFDAPKLNTLYVDRMLRGANLIQAYSRTNRLYDNQTKPFGHIVNYRWPTESEKQVNDALSIYANRDSAYNKKGKEIDDGPVLAPSYDTLVSQTKDIVDDLKELTDDFQYASPSKEECQQTLKKLREYSKNISSIKQYDEYDFNNPDKLMKKIGLSKSQETTLTTKVAHDVREKLQVISDPMDLDLHMEHINDVTIDFDYLKSLLAQLANQVHDELEDDANATYEKLKYNSERSDDQKRARRIMQTADDIKNKSLPKGAINSYPVAEQDVDSIIESSLNRGKAEAIFSFEKQWGLADSEDANRLLKTLIDRHVVGNDDLNTNDELDNIKLIGQKLYRKDATNDAIKDLSIIKYRNSLEQAVEKFIDQLSMKY